MPTVDDAVIAAWRAAASSSGHLRARSASAIVASTSSSARRARCAASASPPCAASMSRSASDSRASSRSSFSITLTEAVAERVGAQVHQLAAQIADRAVERLGRGVGDEQVRDLLEHLIDRGHERARRQPAAAIELDRHLDRRAGRHRVLDRVAADLERADEPAQVRLARARPARSGCAARSPCCPSRRSRRCGA